MLINNYKVKFIQNRVTVIFFLSFFKKIRHTLCIEYDIGKSDSHALSLPLIINL